MATLHTTRVSLFARLKEVPGDATAWGEFVALYAPAVVDWCRRHGLQESDAQDVAQEVLVRFWRRASAFHYDPSRRFRSYLRRMVVNAVADWSQASDGDRLAIGEPSLESLLGGLPARDDLAASIEEAFDMDRLAAAMAEVEARVKPVTWQAFRLLALERLSGMEVATRLGATRANVYMARMNVQRMISETLRRLDDAPRRADGLPLP